MDTNSPVYAQLNKAWKATCRVLFGEEIGELNEYEEWLKEDMVPITRAKSSISGKEVILGRGDYCKDANFISLDEVGLRKIETLSINEIKDIDSIVEAISEKWEYTGNKILGNSKFVESSDTVIDSQYISHSINIQNAMYVYSSYAFFDSKYSFGSIRAGDGCEFVIKCFRLANAKRCFSSFLVGSSSDVYLSSNCLGCSDILFCFSLRNKTHCIGNLQLQKNEYFSLKKKIVSEIAEELKRRKRFPFIFELVKNENPEVQLAVSTEKMNEDTIPINNAFTSTFKVLSKRQISDGMINYSNWLLRHVTPIEEITSPFGSKTYILSTNYYTIYRKMPKKRIVSEVEAAKLANEHLDRREIIDLDTLVKNLSKIAYFTDEIKVGRNFNLIKTPVAESSANMYMVEAPVNSEYAAFGGMVETSKYVFGSGNLVFGAQFCINCYDSLKITRCFEVDCCNNCSDTYFAHNCEGLNEAMFCWNTKGKRYAIGNLQLPPDQYRKIKDMFVEQIADEIIKKKELRYDILNIGCGKR